MSKSSQKHQANFEAALLALTLDRGGKVSLQTQLIEALRQLILSDQSAPGLRLPPSRQLAADLSVSRSTTLGAIDQLLAEGYLEARQGSGTFVARDLPHFTPPKPQAAQRPDPPPKPRAGHVPFGWNPDVTLFPYAAWARHLEAAWSRPHPDLLAIPDPFGWHPLRAAIARHLEAWRGISCRADQVIITSGASEGFDLIASLFAPRARIALEAPSFGPMLTRIKAAGLEPHFVPVDEDGFDPTQIGEDVAGIVVTPSRQYPLGMTLPVARRLALLDWAERSGGLVVEDDYDSEFRYTGTPLPALASLERSAQNQHGRTIYMGSFSKLLTPSLRLGYLVVPSQTVARLHQAMAVRGSQASLVPQPALARFMDSGEFATHLRRMRRVYAQRHAVLHHAIAARLGDWLTPDPQPSGMHLLCWPGPRLAGHRDADVAAHAARFGVTLSALSTYPAADRLAPRNQGYILGFSAFDEAALLAGVDRLETALVSLATG